MSGNEGLGSNLGDPLDHDNNGEKGGSLSGEASTVAKGAAKKKAAKAKSIYDERVWIILEENDDIPPTGLPVSHNGNPFLIMPGEPVEVPVILLNVLDDAVMARPVVSAQTKQVTGYREQRRFPYRRIDAPSVDE